MSNDLSMFMKNETSGYTWSIQYSPVPNNSPPHLLIFGFFVGSPLSYLDPPLTNFPDFVWKIFQRLLKRIIPFAQL